MPIDIYDFDKTIYAGDSSLDFYLFCIRKQPLLLKYLPSQLWHFGLFILKLETRTNFKSNFFKFLNDIGDIDQYVKEFWGSHYQKIKNWYSDIDHSNDVIVSASPEFLLRPAFTKLKAHTLIGTIMDPSTGKIDGENCRGEEKVNRLKLVFKNLEVNRVYTDHASDAPLLALAKEKYQVKGNQIIRLD